MNNAFCVGGEIHKVFMKFSNMETAVQKQSIRKIFSGSLESDRFN
jgi:hypothetical protein